MRQNLAEWIRRRQSGGRASMSYRHVTRMGIYRLHRGDSLSDAKRRLAGYMDSYALNNASRRAQAELELEHYERWYMSSGVKSLATKSRLAVALVPTAILGGEVPRIDLLLDADRYRAILLGNAEVNWESQLRMPLIQRGVALKLQRPEKLIVVGVQHLDGSGLEETSFSQRRISRALQELQDLSQAAIDGLS